MAQMLFLSISFSFIYSTLAVQWEIYADQALYQRSPAWKYEVERKKMKSLKDAQKYAEIKKYQHFFYCFEPIHFKKQGFVEDDMAVFFRRPIYTVWLGMANGCNWYNRAEPVKGVWSSWSSFTNCIKLKTEDYAHRARIRLCNNPAPLFGGRYCSGNSVEVRWCRPKTKRRKACRVPHFSDSRILKESIWLLKRHIDYIQHKMKTIRSQMATIDREIHNKDLSIAKTKKLVKTYNKSLDVLDKTVQGYFKTYTRYRINNDIGELTEFLSQLKDYVVLESKEIKGIMKKKIEIIRIDSILKDMLYEYNALTHNSASLKLYDKEEKLEERLEINRIVKIANAKLKDIFC